MYPYCFGPMLLALHARSERVEIQGGLWAIKGYAHHALGNKGLIRNAEQWEWYG